MRLVLHGLRPASLGWFDRVGLLSLGLFLLGFVSWVTLLIFLAVAVGTYVGLSWILRHPDGRRRWFYLVGLIALQLTPLCIYKYGSFVCHQILRWDAPGL